jgi:parvulin-like peptidyl-prolyl isomerase
LEAVDAVHQWMRESNQTLLSIQEGIDMMLLNNKVRNAIPDSEIQAYFAEHQLELESVDLYSIRVDSEDKAAELRSQINEEGAPFHDLAVQHSQDEASRHLGGYVGRLRRSDMTGAVEAAVFKAGAGAVIGPIKTDKGWNLFKVAAIHKPTLDEAKDTIRIQLMEQLVTKLTADAAIEHSIFDGTATQSA